MNCKQILVMHSDDSETHAYIHTHYSEIIVTRRGGEKLSPEYKSNM